MNYFVNPKDWLPTTHSIICMNHFEEKLIKYCKKCAVANKSSTYNHNDSRTNPSLLRTPTIPRKTSRKRNIWVDELVLFQAADIIVDIGSISEQNSPEDSTFKKLDNSVQLLNLFQVHECISVHRNLHVPLSYHGLPWREKFLHRFIFESHFFDISREFNSANWLPVDFSRALIFANLSFINGLYNLIFSWLDLQLIICEPQDTYQNFSIFQTALIGYKRLNSRSQIFHYFK